MANRMELEPANVMGAAAGMEEPGAPGVVWLPPLPLPLPLPAPAPPFSPVAVEARLL